MIRTPPSNAKDAITKRMQNNITMKHKACLPFEFDNSTTSGARRAALSALEAVDQQGGPRLVHGEALARTRDMVSERFRRTVQNCQRLSSVFRIAIRALLTNY